MKNDKNIKNMFKELQHEFPEDFGSDDGLIVEAADFKSSHDDCADFDETLLSELVICYKNRVVTISRYYGNDWEIADEGYIRCEYFTEIGKALSIAMKHLSEIKFK